MHIVFCSTFLAVPIYSVANQAWLDAWSSILLSVATLLMSPSHEQLEQRGRSPAMDTARDQIVD